MYAGFILKIEPTAKALLLLSKWEKKRGAMETKQWGNRAEKTEKDTVTKRREI